jgi:hypothetical protein
MPVFAFPSMSTSIVPASLFPSLDALLVSAHQQTQHAEQLVELAGMGLSPSDPRLIALANHVAAAEELLRQSVSELEQEEQSLLTLKENLIPELSSFHEQLKEQQREYAAEFGEVRPEQPTPAVRQALAPVPAKQARKSLAAKSASAKSKDIESCNNGKRVHPTLERIKMEYVSPEEFETIPKSEQSKAA